MKSKWIWLAACVAAASAYLFKNNAGTLTAFICVVVLPLLGMLPLLFAPKLQVELNISASAEKDQAVKCKVKISNKRSVPVFGVDMLAQCRNLRTGQEEQMKYRFSLAPKGTKCMEFSLCSGQCGLLQLSVQLNSCRDLFGMQRKKLSCEAKHDLMVLPVLFQTHLAFSEQAKEVPDSEIYSTEKPGNDPGEIFAIREYMPGDSIRKIHWKLSEKCDKTMVRDFGLQIINDVLVLLETAGAASPEETDMITEVYASVCQELANNGVVFQTGWRDPDSDTLLLQMISSPAEFPDLLSELMCVPPRSDGSVAERFAQQIGQCDFSHLIIVGAQIPAGVQDLVTDNRISILTPRREGVSGGLQPDGTYVVQFGADSYMAELSALEV